MTERLSGIFSLSESMQGGGGGKGGGAGKDCKGIGGISSFL